MAGTKPAAGQTGVEPALPGSLDREAYADLVTFRDFLDDRDQAMLSLYGVQLPRSLLRDTLVRAILIEFGGDRVQHVAFYKRGLAYLGGGAAVRNELAQLEALGLVMLSETDPSRRQMQVIPTQRLVDWYSAAMPKLYVEIREFLAIREGKLRR